MSELVSPDTNDVCATNNSNTGSTETTVTLQSNGNLSKNQLKKLKRQEFRQITKQKKKEASRKRKHSDVCEGSTLDEPSSDIEAPFEIKPPQHIIFDKSKNERKLKAAEEYTGRCAGNFTVIIDCDWEDKHSESTLKSLTQQIMFCYGINRRHNCPAPLFLTGVGPKITTNLNKSNFHNWIGVTIESSDYLALPNFTIAPQDRSNVAYSGSNSSSNLKQLVYLTSDAEETLETLEPDCAYIIGGIVDRNKHKFATFNKAKAQGVRVAKLPIKENFALAATHILTVNHVYEILLNYALYKDWVRAIKEVMPSRKCPVEKEEVANAGDGIVAPESVVSTAAAAAAAGGGDVIKLSC